MIVHIARVKQYARPGEERGFAWRWLYQLKITDRGDALPWGRLPPGHIHEGDAVLTTSADTLFEAREIARRTGGGVVLDWEGGR